MVAETGNGSGRPSGRALGRRRVGATWPVWDEGVSRPHEWAVNDSFSSLEPWYDSSSEGKSPLRTSAA